MNAPVEWGPEMSLSEVLAKLGFTHERAEHGKRRVLRDGVEVGCGDYLAIAAWLTSTGLVTCSHSVAADIAEQVRS